MIKIGSIEDRNRFCFFMKEGNRPVCFRYTTLFFGFNASPFILNFIIKHHARIFPANNCTDMLKKNVYVDNLIKPVTLLKCYQTYTQWLIIVWKRVIITLDRGIQIVKNLKL